MKNKRGQVTLFVILGIIVILVIGIAVFLIGQSKSKIDEDIFNEEYTARLAPIHDDIVFCTETLGKEAIIKLGQTGGYTNVNPLDYEYNSFYAYNNNALELFPDSGIVLPYWSYISDDPNCRDCTYVQNYPILTGQGNSIQNHLETYVEDNLISCLDNFSAYKFDFDITYDKLPACNVEIRDETVFFGVDWKIDVKFPDGTIDSVSKFTKTIDVRLKQIYEYALSILFQTEMLEDSRAFEYFTKDIISFQSFGGDTAVIPPMSGPTVFELSAPTIWLQRNVQDTLKNAVAETIPYMQVPGTKDSFILFTNNSIENNFYSNFQNVVYYDDNFASQVRVRFNYYPIWPFYVSVGPSDGPVIMPESSTIDMWILKISTTRYRFYYDVSYPVLVTLEDDSAFNGEGFTFNFPFEVNLKDNDPYSNETIEMSDYFAETEEIEDLGYSQRTVPVLLNVIDGYTNLPVENVPVSYTCIDKEYIVGTSEITNSNPNAIIESYLAPCIGGTFSVSISGYSESPVYRDIILDEPLVLDYYIYPAKSINLELRKKLFEPVNSNNINEMSDIYTQSASQDVLAELKDTKYVTSGEINRGWTISSPEQSVSTMEPDEEVILLMSEIKNDGSTGNVVYFNSNDADKTISLVPGKYSIDVISTLKMGEGKTLMNFTLPKRAIVVNGDYIFINETVIENTMYLGGLRIDDSTTGYFTVTPEDLAKSSFVVYYPSFHPEDMKVIEDFDVLNNVQNATKDYSEYFIPKFE